MQFVKIFTVELNILSYTIETFHQNFTLDHPIHKMSNTAA